MCIFCDIIDRKIPSSIVYEDEDVIAILDISQVTKGHTIVFPKKHVRNIIEADDETVVKTMRIVKKLSEQIVKNTGALGCNIVNNCGETAGQSVDHLHFHIIPRYGTDDAFVMTFNESEKQNMDEVLLLVKG